MESGLTDKAFLITGASGGIGQATARAFAEEGARLALHYHHNRESVLELSDSFDVETVLVQANVSKEEEVAAMPGVLESACIGVPDEATGEAVKLFVVKKDPSITADEVRQYLRKHLVAYKVPKQVEFLDELPKSAVGKILRRELR